MAGAAAGACVSADPAAYDEYVHNLQQQIYFLELESQLLKQQAEGENGATATAVGGAAVTAGVAGATAAAGSVAAGNTSAGAAVNAAAGSGPLSSTGDMPAEFEDIFVAVSV